MQFIIVTGLSGSGKSAAINVLEDIGFYCIDNMPPQLISKFAEIMAESEGKIEKVAIVTDIRGGELFFKLGENIDSLKESGITVKILFLDASDSVIIKRYKETRRKHPLDNSLSGSLQKAITTEREILSSIRAKADYYIDTTSMSISQLKEQLNIIFLENLNDFMIVKVMSFGFKYGIPTEADLVFDVRCLPNPYYVKELKEYTGKDACVSEFVMKFDESKEFLKLLKGMIDFCLPQYIKEGKSQLVIAFGCTGGKHRSVTFAEEIHKHINQKDIRVRISHRDIGRI